MSYTGDTQRVLAKSQSSLTDPLRKELMLSITHYPRHGLPWGSSLTTFAVSS